MRQADSNQRLYFDIIKIKDEKSATGSKEILVSGNTDGSIIIYDLTLGECLG